MNILEKRTNEVARAPNRKHRIRRMTSRVRGMMTTSWVAVCLRRLQPLVNPQEMFPASPNLLPRTPFLTIPAVLPIILILVPFRPPLKTMQLIRKAPLSRTTRVFWVHLTLVSLPNGTRVLAVAGIRSTDNVLGPLCSLWVQWRCMGKCL